MCPVHPYPLYMAGARMATHYPVSIVTHGLALNITVQSYNSALEFGLIACRRAMPDVREFAKYLAKAHQELMKIVQPAVPAEETKRAVQPAVEGKPAKRATVKSNITAPGRKKSVAVKSSKATSNTGTAIEEKKIVRPAA